MSKRIELIPNHAAGNNSRTFWEDILYGKVNEIIEAVNTLREDLDNIIENEHMKRYDKHIYGE